MRAVKTLDVRYKHAQEGCMIYTPLKDVMVMLRECVLRGEPQHVSPCVAELIESHLFTVVARETILLAFASDAVLASPSQYIAAISALNTRTEVEALLCAIAETPKCGLLFMLDLVVSPLIQKMLPHTILHLPTYYMGYGEPTITEQVLINGMVDAMRERTYANMKAMCHYAAILCLIDKPKTVWSVIAEFRGPDWGELHALVWSSERPWGRARFIVLAAIMTMFRDTYTEIPLVLPEISVTDTTRMAMGDAASIFPQWHARTTYATFQSFHERLQPRPSAEWVAATNIEDVYNELFREFVIPKKDEFLYESVCKSNGGTLSARARLHPVMIFLRIPNAVLPQQFISTYLPIVPAAVQMDRVYGNTPHKHGMLILEQSNQLRWGINRGEYVLFGCFKRPANLVSENQRLAEIMHVMDPTKLIFQPMTVRCLSNFLVVQMPEGMPFKIEDVAIENAEVRFRLLVVWTICQIWQFPLPPIESLYANPRIAWLVTDTPSADWGMFFAGEFVTRIATFFLHQTAFKPNWVEKIQRFLMNNKISI